MNGVKISIMPCVMSRGVSLPSLRDSTPDLRRTHEIVDDSEIFVVVSSRAHASFVLVEDEETAFGRVCLRKLVLAAEGLRIGSLDRFAERRRVGIALDLGRFPRDLDRIGLENGSERTRESVRDLHPSVEQNPTHLENAEFLFTKTFAVALE